MNALRAMTQPGWYYFSLYKNLPFTIYFRGPEKTLVLTTAKLYFLYKNIIVVDCFSSIKDSELCLLSTASF